jgi:hypothetical protein
MSWTLINSDAPASFTSNTFSYTIPSGSPSAGQLDVLCVEMFEGTITATPSGWFAVPTESTSGGGPTVYYMYYRIALGGDSATVSLANNINTGLFGGAMLIWQRWSAAGTITADQQAGAANSSNASSSPAVSTGTLAATGELSIAYAGAFNGPGWSGLTWSSPYTALASTHDGGGGISEAAAYNTNAGTAAESPNVSWSSGSLQSQAIIVQTFEASSSAPAGVIQPAAAIPVPRRRLARAVVRFTPVATINATAPPPRPQHGTPSSDEARGFKRWLLWGT